jgi:hypothetical protein
MRMDGALARALNAFGIRLVKLCKWHTMVFRCPCCGKQSEHAAQVVEGPTRGPWWDSTYYCEHCKVSVRARDKWLFGGVYGPLMAMVATLAFEALPATWHVGHTGTLFFAAVCCAIVGYPLSRTLSRHLVYWEPLDPAALRLANLRRLREDEE